MHIARNPDGGANSKAPYPFASLSADESVKDGQPPKFASQVPDCPPELQLAVKKYAPVSVLATAVMDSAVPEFCAVLSL